MKILTWILFTLIPSLGFGQNNYFEGIVIYKFESFSKNPNLDSAVLKQIVGNGSTLFFKDGNYRHSYDGGMSEHEIYRKADNKLYSKRRNNDSTFWTDCGKSSSKIIRFEFTPKKEKILDIDCDELVMYYSDKIVTQYYNSDSLKIDPDWFSNFKSDDEYLIDQKEKAICLKQKIDFEYFTITETAIKFSREPIDDRTFQILPTEILVEEK